MGIAAFWDCRIEGCVGIERLPIPQSNSAIRNPQSHPAIRTIWTSRNPAIAQSDNPHQQSQISNP